MANSSISNLNAHTVPTGSDELAIVTGGVTKKITQANLLSNSLFYTSATPTTITVSGSNDPSPINATGSFPSAPSGSYVTINDQHTKIIFDCNSAVDDDVVFVVGDNLPGTTGMCILEFESSGSYGTTGGYNLWYDGGGRGGDSPYRVYDNTNGYRTMLFDDNDGDDYYALNTRFTMLGNEYTGSFQTVMMYTKIGNNPSGSFYQMGATSFLYQ